MAHTETLFSHKKELNPSMYNNMDGTRGHYVKQSKSQKGMPYYLTYMWNLLPPPPRTKNPTKLTDRESRLVVARDREWAVGEMG